MRKIAERRNSKADQKAFEIVGFTADETGTVMPVVDRASCYRDDEGIQPSDDGDHLISRTAEKPLTYRTAKRTFDILFSSGVIVFGFIPALALSAVIRHDTNGSAIYTQERVGKNGEIFKIYKFRTMVADADDVEKYLDEEQLETWRKERKVDNDPRITPLGNKLRKTSIDEFPQFINVFLGHMSVIGPRPLSMDEVEHFGDDKEELLSVPAGVTGLWQVGERNLATFESGLRQKIELFYVRNSNMSLDAKIFFKTFKAIFERTGR